MRKAVIRCILFLILVFLPLPVPTSAHAGGTDENGGHYDSETGEYHYHHGYEAHQHYDMDGDGDLDCPYNFVDLSGSRSGSSSGSSSGVSSKGSTSSSSSSYDTFTRYNATLPPTQPVVETPVAKTRPISGYILYKHFESSQFNSELTINTASMDCVVKLKDWNGDDVMCFFVKANDTVTVSVPSETLYAYFAEGSTWYGWYDLFGENTHYSRDTEALNFSSYTYEYTLYEVIGGNLSLKSIDEGDF